MRSTSWGCIRAWSWPRWLRKTDRSAGRPREAEMNEPHTDGNAVAGLLTRLMAVEPTTLMRRCQSCGDERPIGEHRAYHGAGIVLRCPSCDDVALVVATVGARTAVELRGSYRMPVA